jgi:hypothetical protein
LTTDQSQHESGAQKPATSRTIYYVVREFDQARFMGKVSELLNQGYRPVGGVSVSHDHSNTMYFTQAVIAGGQP